MRLMSVSLFPTHVQLMIVSLDHSATSGCLLGECLVRGALEGLRICARNSLVSFLLVSSGGGGWGLYCRSVMG